MLLLGGVHGMGACLLLTLDSDELPWGLAHTLLPNVLVAYRQLSLPCSSPTAALKGASTCRGLVRL